MDRLGAGMNVECEALSVNERVQPWNAGMGQAACAKAVQAGAAIERSGRVAGRSVREPARASGRRQWSSTLLGGTMCMDRGGRESEGFPAKAGK